MKEILNTEDNYEEIDLELEDDLEQIDLLGMETDEVSSSLELPRLEIEGLTTEEEIRFLKNCVSKEPTDTTFPLYVIFGLDKLHSGYLDLDLEKILELRFVGCNRYILKLVSDEGSIEILSPQLGDLEIERLINFIRVR